MEQFIYRVKKLIFIISKFFNNSLVSIFYSLNKNQDLEEIIDINRQYLSEIDNFLPADVYKKNDYGIQRRIYEELDKEIVKYPTYSDLMIYIMKLIHGSQNINYLEIGASVLKNYLQMNNAINNSHIYAYDINSINPNFSDLKSISRNNNNLSYFKGSVLSLDDSRKFKLEANKDFDFIFSAAYSGQKILEYPVHYRSRTYGSTQISRFRDGWKLLVYFINSLYRFNVSK